ncbi:hypothetical protein Hanom_Chr04g00354271 [Helianthus anomalus]
MVVPLILIVAIIILIARSFSVVFVERCQSSVVDVHQWMFIFVCRLDLARSFWLIFGVSQILVKVCWRSRRSSTNCCFSRPVLVSEPWKVQGKLTRWFFYVCIDQFL